MMTGGSCLIAQGSITLGMLKERSSYYRTEKCPKLSRNFRGLLGKIPLSGGLCASPQAQYNPTITQGPIARKSQVA